MKGFLSYLVLWILSKEPMNGVNIANDLGKRKGSKSSPGTIYPVLKELREKKLIYADKNKIYTLTKKGEEELRLSCKCFCKTFHDMKEMKECCH